MFKVAAIAVALIVTASGCRSLTGRTAGEVFDDKTTVGTVKTKLVRDRLLNLTWVGVDAKNGVVYLTGNVDTAAQKARATELAAETSGVTRVVNDLVVNSAQDTASAPARSAAASSTSSASSTARSSSQPSASPVATTSSARAGSGTIAGDVVTVDQRTGHVTLRSGGSDFELRLPPESVRNVKPGDRLSLSVNAIAR
jgi:hypothetical protein